MRIKTAVMAIVVFIALTSSAVATGIKAPARLHATLTAAGHVKVTWSATPAAAGYQVARRTTGHFFVIANTSSTGYTDLRAPNGRVIYRVRARTAADHYGAYAVTGLVVSKAVPNLIATKPVPPPLAAAPPIEVTPSSPTPPAATPTKTPVKDLVGPPVTAPSIRWEAETATGVPNAQGGVLTDPNASGGKYLYLYGNATANGTFTTTATTAQISLNGWGNTCGTAANNNGGPNGEGTITLKIDGTTYLTNVPFPYAWTTYTTTSNIPAGNHTIQLIFANSYTNGSVCNRTVAQDHVDLTAAAGPTYLFQDDFTGAAGTVADTTKWVDWGPGCGAYSSFGKIACGTDKLDGAGHLVLAGTPTSGSAIQTQGKFSFEYGTMSAWIKMPAQAGYWPGFWSLNGTQTGTQLHTGEIDTTEVYSTWHGSNSTTHAWNGGGAEWSAANTLSGTSVDLTAGYHKYTTVVAPGLITFKLDDVQVGQVNELTSGTPWEWGNDNPRGNWLILQNAVGGAGQATPTANSQVLVDRVEVTSP